MQRPRVMRMLAGGWFIPGRQDRRAAWVGPVNQQSARVRTHTHTHTHRTRADLLTQLARGRPTEEAIDATYT
jgi:hypothetical protein